MKTRILVALAAVLLIFGVGIALAADLHHNILPKKSISPDTSVSNNDNTDGSIIDRYGFGSVTYIIESGTLADSDVTLTPHLQVCALDNCDDAVDATSTELLGTVAEATFAATDDNTAKSIGYNGGKRYSRLRITPASNTGAARFSAIAVLGHPKYAPAQ